MKYIKWLCIFAALGVALDILSAFVYPDVSLLKRHNPKTTAFIEYRKNQWAGEGVDKPVRQQWVKLKKISPYLVKAVIIGEDDKFWKHDGFDFVAMKKALEKDIAEGKLKAGGSSISQQLAKNLYLSPSKNPLRKIKEAILTWRLERALSKKRIMEIYLNIAEWGDGVFGIEAASKYHYGKKARYLSAQEAVRLASVLPNPIVFNPRSDSAYVRKRSRAIYRVMLRRGIVIPEYEEVMSAPEEKTEEAPVDIMTMGLDGVTPTEQTDSPNVSDNPSSGDSSSTDGSTVNEQPSRENGSPFDPVNPVPAPTDEPPPDDTSGSDQESGR
jgi:monofunctional biosynthetic peptidoglycan transglycosylase